MLGPAIGMPSCTVRAGTVAKCVPAGDRRAQLDRVQEQHLRRQLQLRRDQPDAGQLPAPTHRWSPTGRSARRTTATSAATSTSGPSARSRPGGTSPARSPTSPTRCPPRPIPPSTPAAATRAASPTGNYIHTPAERWRGGTYWFTGLTVNGPLTSPARRRSTSTATSRIGNGGRSPPTSRSRPTCGSTRSATTGTFRPTTAPPSRPS